MHDDVHHKLAAIFGTTVHGWPQPDRVKPRWWNRASRRRESRINDALAKCGYGPIHDGMREAYWKQARIGQGVHEDAGGYIWRCWCALLGLPVEEPTLTYKRLAQMDAGEFEQFIDGRRRSNA